MNPRNSLRELIRIYQLGKADERAAVRTEAHSILARDLVLKEAPFDGATNRILALLVKTGPLATSKEEGASAKSLLTYFVAELAQLIEARYVLACLEWLEKNLLPTDPIVVHNQQPATLSDLFDEIYTVTSHLLSTLIDQNTSLESLYALYSEVLVPRYPKSDYVFARRFGLLQTLITQSPKRFRIVLSLENVSQPGSFPPEIGGITFSQAPPFTVTVAGVRPSLGMALKYLTPASNKMFASTIVDSSADPRSAGAEAAEALNYVLNLVRFEYERGKVVMPNSFAFMEDGQAGQPRLFLLPSVVPNPSTLMDSDGLTAFVKGVDELVGGGRFDAEGRDRVQSAFRLYRTGLDTDVLENKLVNWWTAIEFLVRGSSNTEPGGIARTVEQLLVPVLCNSYVAKHLLTLRSLLLDSGISLTDPVTSDRIYLKGMAIHELYELFLRADIQASILSALTRHIFVFQQTQRFFAELIDPKILHRINADHEQRLRWQLQRLWRARCNIVHSAERTVNAALLCANLEYYLKTTLTALLRALQKIKTLTGPKEFFDRQAHAYELLQNSLQTGRDDELRRALQS